MGDLQISELPVRAAGMPGFDEHMNSDPLRTTPVVLPPPDELALQSPRNAPELHDISTPPVPRMGRFLPSPNSSKKSICPSTSSASTSAASREGYPSPRERGWAATQKLPGRHLGAHRSSMRPSRRSEHEVRPEKPVDLEVPRQVLQMPAATVAGLQMPATTVLQMPAATVAGLQMPATTVRTETSTANFTLRTAGQTQKVTTITRTTIRTENVAVGGNNVPVPVPYSSSARRQREPAWEDMLRS